MNSLTRSCFASEMRACYGRQCINGSQISNFKRFATSVATGKPRLVILGSGWGGYEVLRGIDKKRWDVTVLSPTGYFNFTPLLAGCSVGTLEFRCATEPVRRYCPQATAYQAWCDAIDFENKTLQCMPASSPMPRNEVPSTPNTGTGSASPPARMGKPFTIPYDKLVIAVGAYSQTFGTPGVKEHGYFLKDVKDAREIRGRILECFEQASQPNIDDSERRRVLNFCIVGAGPTGVEFAAELHDLLHTEIQRHFPNLTPCVRISLYDVAPNILGSFDKELVKYTERKFARDGITILTNHHVERVEKGKLFVKEQGEVPFGLLVWNTGLAPNPLVESINEVKKNEHTHSLLTDDHLNVIRRDGNVDPDVWAIGDAAQMAETRLPATAQVANQEAKYMVKKLNRLAKGKDNHEPFRFHNQGSLAYIGDWRAIYDRSSAESVQTKNTGRLAWLLWRSAYFTQTLSIRNKILVPFYWFLNWIFGRDITRL